MTPEQWSSLRMTDWNRLLGFASRRFPKLGKYGSEPGQYEAENLVGLMQNVPEMARIADALFKIDCAYKAAVEPLQGKLEKAHKDRQDAEKALLETIRI